MPRLEPFTGYVVAPAHAARVVAPPFDTLSPEQRRAARADPDSFLGVLPPRPETGTVLGDCRRHLDHLLAAGRFEQLDGPTLAVLRLDDGRRVATGVLGDVAAERFEDGSIAPHEQIRPATVAALRRHLEVVGAVSSPVCVAHEPDDRCAELTAAVTGGVPDVEVVDAAGSLRLWLVTDPTVRDELGAAVGATTGWLVADGHHRAAAARPAGRVLSVLVPHDQLEIRPFHRRLPADDPTAAGARLRERGLEVIDLPGAAAPDGPGEVTVAGGGRWWRVRLPAPANASDPVEALDVVRTERHLLAPLSGGRQRRAGPPQPLTDGPEVTAVAPTDVPDELERDGQVTVVLHPPSWAEVRAVVEAGHTMPPKSTYVAPKQRSGLVVVPRPQRLPSGTR